jgi:DNA-binding transcriptional MerR regulator
MSTELDRPVYSIGAVSRLLNVPAPTLRAWEDRYSLVTPVRSTGSQRLYSRGQLEHLRFIKAQIDSGVSAADAHRLLAERIGAEPVSSASAGASADGRQPLVLIADRDQYAAELVAHFLRSEGYTVEIALDAADASRQFAERPPEAVIVDLLISGNEGFRLVTEFSGSRKAQVIAVASLNAGDEAERIGADAFLQKPIDPERLLEMLRGRLGAAAGAQ